MKIGKCKSCGDDKISVIMYNGNESCVRCLGSNRRGDFEQEIINRITGKYKSKKNYKKKARR